MHVHLYSFRCTLGIVFCELTSFESKQTRKGLPPAPPTAYLLLQIDPFPLLLMNVLLLVKDKFRSNFSCVCLRWGGMSPRPPPSLAEFLFLLLSSFSAIIISYHIYTYLLIILIYAAIIISDFLCIIYPRENELYLMH